MTFIRTNVSNKGKGYCKHSSFSSTGSKCQFFNQFFVAAFIVFALRSESSITSMACCCRKRSSSVSDSSVIPCGLERWFSSKLREGGNAVGGHIFGLTAAIHSCANRKCAAARRNHPALKNNDAARENQELGINALEHKQHSAFCVNLLRHSEIRTLQKPLRATACEKGLVVIQAGEFNEYLGISGFHIQRFKIQ